MKIATDWDAIIVGSGAGGGIVASRLAGPGRRVLLIEAGGHHRAGSFSRWELQAMKNLWKPPAFARTRSDGTRPIAMVSGQSVGGTTNINTKVGIRAQEQDYRKWYESVGLQGADGAPFGAADLDPWFEIAEQQMRLRKRDDWTHGVSVLERGFNKLGTNLQSVTAYTDSTCESCGSCTSGCMTNAGSTTQNRYIEPAIARRGLDLLSNTMVTQVITQLSENRREVKGVEVQHHDGSTQELHAPIVVLAASALVTPQILQLSGLANLGTASSSLIGQTLGTHTSRICVGRYEEIMDAHIVFPITAHCADFADDEKGGFTVEAITVQDPIAQATNFVDDNFEPLWGRRLTEMMQNYRHLAGTLVMTNDSNVGTIKATDDLQGEFEVLIPPMDQDRLDKASEFAKDVQLAAGAKDVVSTGYFSSHMQGSVRMGSDPERSSCDENQQLWDVEGLYIGDSSAIPRTLTFNPSLTIMALAERLAAHLNSGASTRLARAKTELRLAI